MNENHKRLITEWAGLNAQAVKNFDAMCNDPNVSRWVRALLDRAETHRGDSPAQEPSSAPVHNGTSCSDTNSCIVCVEPATNVCNGCAGVPEPLSDGEPNVYYCSRECQLNDRERHKVRCNKMIVRKIMHRIAVQLWAIWSEIRSATCDEPVESVELQGDTLYVHVANEFMPLGMGYFYPFTVLQDPDEKHLRETVLAANQCNDAAALTSHILEVLLHSTGRKFDVCEIEFKAKNVEFWTRIVQSDGQIRTSADVPHHSVFKVWSVKTMEGFVVDLAGAQFGWTEKIELWDNYAKEKIWHETQNKPFGDMRELCLRRTGFGMKDEKSRMVENALIMITDVVNEVFHDWAAQLEPDELKASLTGTRTDIEKMQAKLHSLLRAVGSRLNKEILTMANRRYEAVMFNNHKETAGGYTYNLKKAHEPTGLLQMLGIF